MRRIVLIAVLVALGTIGCARAEESDAERQARWQDLRHAVFGDRTVEDGAGIVTLDAPPRALDAALVPITIDLAGTTRVKTVYLVIDENPSPLAGTFHFGPAADTRELRTRVRVRASSGSTMAPSSTGSASPGNPLVSEGGRKMNMRRAIPC